MERLSHFLCMKLKFLIETIVFSLYLVNTYSEVFSFLMNGEKKRKTHGLVSTTFLRHFIFDGAVLLIIKLRFFSGNTDLFFKPER